MFYYIKKTVLPLLSIVHIMTVSVLSLVSLYYWTQGVNPIANVFITIVGLVYMFCVAFPLHARVLK